MSGQNLVRSARSVVSGAKPQKQIRLFISLKLSQNLRSFKCLKSNITRVRILGHDISCIAFTEFSFGIKKSSITFLFFADPMKRISSLRLNHSLVQLGK